MYLIIWVKHEILIRHISRHDRFIRFIPWFCNIFAHTFLVHNIEIHRCTNVFKIVGFLLIHVLFGFWCSWYVPSSSMRTVAICHRITWSTTNCSISTFVVPK